VVLTFTMSTEVEDSAMHILRVVVVSGLIGLSLACTPPVSGVDAGLDAGPMVTEPVDAGLRDFVITGTVTRYLQNSQEQTGVDFVADPPGVVVELADGGWVELNSIVVDAGLAQVASVPAGRTFVTWGSLFIETSRSTLDLSYAVVGRRDVTFASAPTPVTLALTGLEPWASTHYLSLSSTNAGLIAESVLPGITPIAAGSVSGSGVYDWGRSGLQLIDSSRGDETVVSQHVGRTIGSTLYRAISRAATVSMVTLQNGQPATLQAALQPLAETFLMSFEWRTAEWEALRPQTGAAATYYRQVLSVHALPNGGASLDVSPGLVFLAKLPGEGPVQGTVTSGNPFPAAWPLVAYQRASFDQRVVALGLEVPWRMSAYDVTEVSQLSTGVLQPRLGAPLAVLINGEDANANLAGVGLTPTISWTAPTLGVPERYRVLVWQAANVNGELRFQSKGQLLTKSTHVRIPPGVLEAGTTCFLTVTAEQWGTNDLEVLPVSSGLPARGAGTVTQPFSP
jgi:hypothetical protein